MTDETTDIHGTNHRKLPHVLELVRAYDFKDHPETHGVTVRLNFYPTDEQMQSLWELLLTWHP